MSSQPKRGMPVWLIVVLIVIVVLILVFAALGLMAYLGMRRYISLSKTAEATSQVSLMALDADTAFTADGKLCPSASHPVPASILDVTAKKYASTPIDWNADSATKSGFSCLRFETSNPQYYQYDYKSTPTSFTAAARGDLDGNGVTSEFSKSGTVSGTSLTIDPGVASKNPTE